jgi:hypothetical protein
MAGLEDAHQEFDFDHEEVEQWLLMTMSSDMEAVHAATEPILGVVASEGQCLEVFWDIICESSEPQSRRLASLYLIKSLEIHRRGLSDMRLTKFSGLFVMALSNPDEDPEVIRLLIDCLAIAAEQMAKRSRSAKIWDCLVGFFAALELGFDPLRFLVLSRVVQFLPAPIVESQSALYGSLADAGVQTGDWPTILASMEIVVALVDASQSISGFDFVFATVCQLLPVMLQQPVTIQSGFWLRIRKLFKLRLFPVELIAAVLESLSCDGISGHNGHCALDVFDLVFDLLSSEQLFLVIELLIRFLILYLDEEAALPVDPVDILKNIFDTAKHEPIYRYLIGRVGDLVQSGHLTIALHLVVPIVTSANKQMSGEVQMFCDLIAAGLTSGESLSIHAACEILEFVERGVVLFTSVPQFLTLLFPLLHSEDSDVRQDSLGALAQLLSIENQQIPTVFEQCWAQKDVIPPDDFLLLLARSLACSPTISDASVQAVGEFIIPFLSMDATAVGHGLYALSYLSQHAEATIFELLPQTVPAVQACLAADTADARVYALDFVTIIVTNFGAESLPFAGQVWDDVVGLLAKKRPKERLKRATLECAIAIAKASGDGDLLPPILERLVVLLRSRNDIDLAIQCVGRIIQLLSTEQSVGLFEQVLAQCGKSNEREACAVCLSTLAKFVKHANDETLPIVLPQVAELCEAVFAGELPALAGKSLTDDGCDITADFLERLSDLMTSVVQHASDIVAPLCQHLLALLARPEDTYRSMTLGVLISAIESDTATDALYEALVAAVPDLVGSTGSEARQNMVYLLILLAKRNVQFLAAIEPLFPVLTEWWGQADGCAMVRSNLASLFLFMAAVQVGSVADELMMEVLQAFPPADREEANFMAENLLKVMAQGDVAVEIRVKAGIGIAKLLTETKKNLRKMNIRERVLNRIVVLFKAICESGQDIVRAVLAEFQESSGKQEKLAALLQRAELDT